MNKSLIVVGMVAITFTTIFFVLLAHNSATLTTSKGNNRVLRSGNALQATMIITQIFGFSRFNQTAENASRLNSLADVSSDSTVIGYRETLHREKIYNLPVPVGTSDKLLGYTSSLRADVVRVDPRSADTVSGGVITTNTLMCCRAVLWVKSSLTATGKASNQSTGTRGVEEGRQWLSPI